MSEANTAGDRNCHFFLWQMAICLPIHAFALFLDVAVLSIRMYG